MTLLRALPAEGTGRELDSHRVRFRTANVGVHAAPSGRAYVDQREAFLARCVGETFIKRDD